MSESVDITTHRSNERARQRENERGSSLKTERGREGNGTGWRLETSIMSTASSLDPASLSMCS
jgi:hypothetical protein